MVSLLESPDVSCEAKSRKAVYRDCLTGSDVKGWNPERAALATEGWSCGIVIS